MSRYPGTLYEMTDGEFTNEDILGGRAEPKTLALQTSSRFTKPSSHKDFTDRVQVIPYLMRYGEGETYAVPRNLPLGEDGRQ